MATALFIKRSDIVKHTILNGNVDTDKFIPYILYAQQSHIQNYLGTKLYDKISTDILGTGGASLTGAYLELVNDHIQPMLIHYAFADYIADAPYDLRNGGLVKHRTENGETPSVDEVNALMQRSYKRAEFYLQRFLDHMSFIDPSTIPEYYTNQNSDMYPDKDTNPLPIYLG